MQILGFVWCYLAPEGLCICGTRRSRPNLGHFPMSSPSSSFSLKFVSHAAGADPAEITAARELAKGKNRIDAIDGGFYRSASAIPLTGGCVSCHGGFFRAPDKTPRFAGLVISIPVKK